MMREKTSKLQVFFDETFENDYIENCLIEVDNKESEIVLSANREGMLYLINRLIELCEHNKAWSHYHLDEAGMANKCNKPMVISFIKED
ncbi:MAG: hypothetical protein FWC70_12345 [Defluviitaleaceae bacterium]|nr:hypothetical protein [Defluviitaleaceae bacterium]